MLTSRQIDRVLGKLKRFENTLETMLFTKVASLEAEMYETEQNLDSAPKDAPYYPAVPGAKWGGEWKYCWFRTSYTVPEELADQPIYLWPEVGGQEVMLFINDMPAGIFTKPQNGQSHGDHYCNLLTMGAPAGTVLNLDMEGYAWHYIPGTQPLTNNPMPDFLYQYTGIDICVKNPEINQFYFDLKTFNQMVEALDENSFVRAEIIKALMKVHETVYYSPEDVSKELFLEALAKAQDYLTELYKHHNTDLAPVAKVIGHSHMDTAWLWPMEQTVKKCARTYSNQLKLMEEYPEYRFIQSSAYHIYMMKVHYPALYKGMQEAVKKGQYEPNGGVWVECDCNITGGEWMVRQFVWGQLYTQKEFGYLSNAFWLPDTFGYTAALPQIMKGCKVDYFLTTKIAWNDTNQFPYDTFYWQGIDGSRVLSHFNKTHLWPDPHTCIDFVVDGHFSHDCLQEKTVTNKRLLAYGHGDGGGGPLFEMIEMARRCEDIEGCPKVETTRVDDFMRELESELVDPSIYRGELYLELHRGTLTNQHNIKRNNRKGEIAIHNAEYALVRKSLAKEEAADNVTMRPFVNTLLVNQFHDILPGTCIHTVHEKSLHDTGEMIEKTRQLFTDTFTEILSQEGENVSGQVNAVSSGQSQDSSNVSSQEETCTAVTFLNPLGFARKDAVYLDGSWDSVSIPGSPESVGNTPDIALQHFTDMDGQDKTVLYGAKLPSLSGKALQLHKASSVADNATVKAPALGTQQLSATATDSNAHPAPSCATSAIGSVFRLLGDTLETPLYTVRFNEKMYISSLYDKRADRELVEKDSALNTLLIAEDLPLAWDNWDVDADIEYKFKDSAELLSTDVVSCGDVECRIRNTYRLTDLSTMTQDMVFYKEDPMIRFDTRMDWQDNHRLLKAAFPTNIMTDYARQEIQFGHVLRPTTRNTSIEKAKFEVCNHRFTDLSELHYGVALLNDCKYGISVKDGCMALTLHKGGCRPDATGDKGIHECTYALVPHVGNFSAETVVEPAYCLNIPVQAISGISADLGSLASLDQSGVMIETIKPAESGERSYILRIYETEGCSTKASLTLGHEVKAVYETNMLEENIAEVNAVNGSFPLSFHPFEIKTIRVDY